MSVPGVLTGKRQVEDGTYVVLVTCPACLDTREYPFAGWREVSCKRCFREIRRTVYRREAYRALVVAQMFADRASRTMTPEQFASLVSVPLAGDLSVELPPHMEDARRISLVRAGMKEEFEWKWSKDAGSFKLVWSDVAKALWRISWEFVLSCGPDTLADPTPWHRNAETVH